VGDRFVLQFEPKVMISSSLISGRISLTHYTKHLEGI